MITVLPIQERCIDDEAISIASFIIKEMSQKVDNSNKGLQGNVDISNKRTILSDLRNLLRCSNYQ
jgi:hypothetical protein